MGINKEWHEKNKMPKNANDEARYKWHLEHEKHCDCREMPEELRKKWKNTKIEF